MRHLRGPGGQDQPAGPRRGRRVVCAPRRAGGVGRNYAELWRPHAAAQGALALPVLGPLPAACCLLRPGGGWLRASQGPCSHGPPPLTPCCRSPAGAPRHQRPRQPLCVDPQRAGGADEGRGGAGGCWGVWQRCLWVLAPQAARRWRAQTGRARRVLVPPARPQPCPPHAHTPCLWYALLCLLCLLRQVRDKLKIQLDNLCQVGGGLLCRCGGVAVACLVVGGRPSAAAVHLGPPS